MNNKIDKCCLRCKRVNACGDAAKDLFPYMETKFYSCYTYDNGRTSKYPVIYTELIL